MLGQPLADHADAHVVKEGGDLQPDFTVDHGLGNAYAHAFAAVPRRAKVEREELADVVFEAAAAWELCRVGRFQRGGATFEHGEQEPPLAAEVAVDQPL